MRRDTGGKGTLLAQRSSFKTLDNWGHKTPTQSKRKSTGKKRLKGHGLEYVYSTLGYIYISISISDTCAVRCVAGKYFFCPFPEDFLSFLCLHQTHKILFCHSGKKKKKKKKNFFLKRI